MILQIVIATLSMIPNSLLSGSARSCYIGGEGGRIYFASLSNRSLAAQSLGDVYNFSDVIYADTKYLVIGTPSQLLLFKDGTVYKSYYLESSEKVGGILGVVGDRVVASTTLSRDQKSHSDIVWVYNPKGDIKYLGGTVNHRWKVFDNGSVATVLHDRTLVDRLPGVRILHNWLLGSKLFQIEKKGDSYRLTSYSSDGKVSRKRLDFKPYAVNCRESCEGAAVVMINDGGVPGKSILLELENGVTSWTVQNVLSESLALVGYCSSEGYAYIKPVNSHFGDLVLNLKQSQKVVGHNFYWPLDSFFVP